MASETPEPECFFVSPYADLLTHNRFLLTLRSQEGRYHSLILFRLSSVGEQIDARSYHTPNEGLPTSHPYNQLYAMESTCPHLGADMSHAEIEECETGIVAVCPWHRYDFDLRTGHSETGLRACTYTVQVKEDEEDRIPCVWIQSPEQGSKWRVLERRGISEEFADPVKAKLSEESATSNDSISEQAGVEPIIPLDGEPTTLIQWAVLILNTPNPTLKVQRTQHAVHLFRTGKLASIGHKNKNPPIPPAVPPREENYTRNTVDPRKLAKRKNAAVMLHALANIEQWAIDLAWDIMARFGPSHPDIPPAFFSDFARMALDESKHFSLLVSRLAALSPSTPYGSLPVHAGLWESATVTSTSLRSRLAIIHLVHEARGLDVNPGTIERFRRSGDKESVATLEVIHTDEVTHVTTGHRWFTWICERDGVDPVSTFREEVRCGWRGDIKGPFNAEARETAGLTREFYEDLHGEMDQLAVQNQESQQTAVERASADVTVAYEAGK
ncbi:DUF455-domain-containing protein [Coniophora puteana RWD-64-598 SS2]|uniref:DUF455-domain-containing protein n=1 Tax=Coniophora puteana (strain RWD-64-598) TaxID=741705 RepID=R7SFU9_CONPW|nr:DUF455-domain-containing protein [Coniophora puteana RWD-64-598 SS2]EIW73964.1 DUF455-domain-containing protein [Coniophora puteana RWD-64-598 SS2]